MTGDGAAARRAAAARRELSGRVVAATFAAVRDLDVAEDATAEAFLLAVQHWPDRGVPESVEAWLITAARRRAIDRVRQGRTSRAALGRLALDRSLASEAVTAAPDAVIDAALVGDDELRLVVLCCDPRISADEQVALTLRLACGVPTASIAAAYRLPTATMAARITRAKAKLVRAGHALDLPDDATVDQRLPVVARVLHLAFTLGHTAVGGDELTDDALADHAQYLAGALHALRPHQVEVTGVLALILLTRARAPGRFDGAGVQVVLADADRTRWDATLIARGVALFDRAWAAPGPRGPMILQAAVAAAQVRAAGFADVDWAAVVDLYASLLELDPSPVTALGRCVALSHAMGPHAGLADLDEVLALTDVAATYPYARAARADMLERAGRGREASAEWEGAAALARNGAERTWFLSRARS